MAAELLSLTQLQKLAQHHQQPLPEQSPISAWMWNPNQLSVQEDDDSWEIRAFEQDTTGNINGTTWPPRSYTCTFCRREFRSAQALGGHMNVHRRDRARLHHQAQPPQTGMHSNFPSSASALLIPAPEFVNTNGGLCLFYSLANPNHGMSPKHMNSCNDSPSSKPLSQKSNFTRNDLIISTIPNSLNSSICNEPCASNTSYNLNSYESPRDSAIEELDLELRLGRR